MPYLPISKEGSKVTPFTVRKSWNLSDLNTGVLHYYAESSSIGTTSNSIYGAVRNMYGTGAATVFGQKNLTCPERISVIGISSWIYGEEIIPSTFSLQDNYFSPIVVNIEDDGRGNLWDSDIKGSTYGGYYKFNGSGSRHFFTSSVNFSPSYSDFMVEFIGRAAPESESAIISKRSTTSGGWEIHLVSNSQHLGFTISESVGLSESINTSHSYADGNDHHVFVVVDRNDNVTTIMDGAIGSVTGVDISPLSSSFYIDSDLYIGARYNLNNSSSLSGNLNLIRLYDFGSGSLPFDILTLTRWNYYSGSIHPGLREYLVEEWSWVSGSNKTGSASDSLAIKFTANQHYRSSQPVGNIFYTNGLCVFTETSNPPYIGIGSGSAGTGYEIDLVGSVKYNELRFECVSPASQQNATTNPTSVWGTGNLEMIELGTSSWEYQYQNFETYVTKIGLYNDNYELMAIANLAQPIPKPDDMDITFCVRMDL